MENKWWNRYEAGKNYNKRLKPSYYENISANNDFFNGNQWAGLEGADLPKPVFNVINRIVTYYIASITSTKTKAVVEPMAYMDDDEQFEQEMDYAMKVSAQIGNLFEKFRLQNIIRNALLDGALSGDYCLHVWFDPNKRAYGGAFRDIMGEIDMEVVDGSNVYFGNPNNPRTDIQPYIIIAGRDLVENLKAEAKQYKDEIESDDDFEEQLGQGGQIEIEPDDDKSYGKATYIYVYEKKDETVMVSKYVKTGAIFENVDTGLSHYPVAWANWERQKNQYHGRALVTGIIPAQIYINKMFAMLMYDRMVNAFPKVVYNADKIAGWTSEVNVAIPVRDLQPGESVQSVAAYLEPSNASPQVIQTIELAMKYTKEMLGATDAALGEIRPENAAAIAQVTKQSTIPLEYPKANLHEWVSDIVEILIDMMGTYYGVRPVVMDMDGVKQYVDMDYTRLKDVSLHTKVDIGSGSYWSEISAVQTLDNLLMQEKITFLQWLERVPEAYMPNKAGLIEEIKAQAEAAQQQMMMQEQQFEQMAQWLETQPPEIQQQIMSLPPEQQEMAIQQMMTQTVS